MKTDVRVIRWTDVLAQFLSSLINEALRRFEYEQKASQGLLAGGVEEALGRKSTENVDSLKSVIVSKVDLDDKVSSDTMVGAYECLEMIANSEKILIDDILGADDIFTVNEKEEVFKDVNEKYSLQPFFSSIQQRSTQAKESNLITEAAHFFQILNEHPIPADDFYSGSSNTSHGALARLIAIQRLEKALLVQKSILDASENMLGDLHRLLISICCSKEPEKTRVISSRCLGELNFARPSALELENFNPYEMIESLNDPMLSIKKTILAILGQYILSDCATTSLVAMKTTKALLAMPAGKECWLSLNGKQKGLLSPFYTHNDVKQRGESVRVSDSCLKRLMCDNDLNDGTDWCWDDRLWKCTDSEESSCEVWIKKIVVCIIRCCFGKGSRGGRGDQSFFRICQGMCAKDAVFAASVFPALVFYLLDSNTSIENGEECSVRGIAIGSPTSDINKTISHCFSRILSPISSHRVAPQAIRVILNTLELLRSITEHRFHTYSGHTKNKLGVVQQTSTVSNKSRSGSSSSVCIAALNSCKKWRGYPYGVVLKMSGLDVADACFRVKRYYSAIYYAEMSMNNITGIGAFFEHAANGYSLDRSETICDISGFGELSELQGDETVLEKALIAKDIIERCLSVFDANDELQGILSQGSALKLKRNILSLGAVEDGSRDRSAEPQSMTDTSSMSDTATDNSHAYSPIGNYSEVNRFQFGANIQSRLREQWFEDSLHKTRLWDDVLLPQSNGGRCTTSHLLQSPHSFASQSTAVFYESIYEALQCFIKDHVTEGLGYVLRARKSVLADMDCLAGSEAQSSGMLTNLTKLNALGHLELLARTLEKTSGLAYLLDRWGLQESLGEETLEEILLNNAVIFDLNEQDVAQSYRSIRTELSVKEISLKLLRHKFNSGDVVISKALISHIYKSCSVYRELGHPYAAKNTLSSLRSVIQALQNIGKADISSGKLPLILRLEDAKIMKSQNNLDGAIMTAKMIANYLVNAKSKSTDVVQDQICADSLLLGGLWMAENNVDSVETIYSSFEKAARLAKQTCRREQSNSNIHRSSMSSFKLGEFAANLYNSVLVRVSSEAWRRRRIAANERKQELRAVASRLSELQKKSRAPNEDIMDARIINATLSREVLIDDRELQCIEKSIQRYLRLSFESYCIALKLAPTTMAGVSKHVFQLLSLWFKNCQRKETQDIVNDLLKSNLSQIPSYRLVPLTYQLFSRIDEIPEDGDSGFQDILRDVVLKICSDHPYHSIVQILALSNGQRIGGGVNGRHANAYLENVGTTKVDAVNNIIKELRKRAPEYVIALIDSYQTLMISYINLAEFDTSAIQKRMTKRISFKQCKLNLDVCLSSEHHGKRSATVTNMPTIITKPPDIRPDKQYGNGVDDPIGTERVVRFESTFDLTPTGIHRPKIVECIGSKGGRFKQLVKGEDDLRQDAIMQQVFGTVNDLLRHESHSLGSTRRLRLITYGITPLSPASGVLEWVDNTMCFGDFLTDRGKKVGAHSKYFPGGA